jgi:Flp pilus assembly protein TadD
MKLPSNVAGVVAVFALLLVPRLASCQSSSGTQRTYKIPQPDADPDQQLFAKAQSDLDKQNYSAAVLELQQYIVKKPQDAAAHFLLGYAYTALKNPGGAAAEYAKAAELNPKMAEAQLNLGLTLLDSSPANAVAPLAKAVELMPDQARPKLSLGWAFERSGQSTKAIEQYKAAEKQDPTNFSIHIALARTLLASDKPADAEPEFHAALALKPDATAPRLGLAQCLIARKDTAAAIDVLQDYLKSQPDDAETRIQLASLLRDAARPADALAQLQLVSGNDATVIAAEKMRVEIYMDQKDTAKAAAALSAVVHLAPRDAEARASLGRLKIQLKDYRGAVLDLAEAYRLNPKDDDVLRNLAAAHFLAGDYPGALEVLSALEQRSPLAPGEWFLRAVANDKLGRVQDAYNAYNKFLELNKGAQNDNYFDATARVRLLERELKNGKK